MAQCCQPLNHLNEDDDFRRVIYESSDDETGAAEQLLSKQGDVENAKISPQPSLHPLRAVASSHVLAEFGKIFAENGRPQNESEANSLYALSRDASFVDHFVSHSWSAPRMLKWAAISDYYNRRLALFLANAWWLLATLILAAWRCYSGQAVDFLLAFLLLIGVPAFILCTMAAFGHRCFPKNGSNQFVDRICIHQWDDALKQEGIKGLGQVLSSAKKMMVLWSEDYFYRIWCIFEVSTFDWGPSKMELLPLWVAPFLYGLLLCNVVVVFLGAIMESTEYFGLLMESWGLPFGIGWFWTLCNLGPAMVMCVFIHRGIKQKEEMEHWVANFALNQTLVSVEADREYIYNQIRRRFGSLSDFEALVQTDLLSHLRRVVRAPWSFPFAWGAFVFQPYLWYMSVDIMATTTEQIRAQVIREHVLTWPLYAFANVFGYPFLYIQLALALKALACSSYLTLRWPRILAFTFNTIVFSFLVFITGCIMTMMCCLLSFQTLVVQHPMILSR